MIHRIRDAAPLAAVIVMLVIFNVMASGCDVRYARFDDNNEVRLYKTLKASAEAYNGARLALRQYDRTKPFTPEQKAKIEQYAEDYRLAYHLALEAWEMYRQGKGSESEWLKTANDALDAIARLESEVKYE